MVLMMLSIMILTRKNSHENATRVIKRPRYASAMKAPMRGVKFTVPDDLLTFVADTATSSPSTVVR